MEHPAGFRVRDDERLFRSLYAQLRAHAERLMGNQPPQHTLQPTALVHEVLLKIWEGKDPTWNDRAHFLATAARAMRQVLIDHARGRAREKRSPPGARMPLDSITAAYEEHAIDLLALNEALETLARMNPTMVRAVELIFFGGVSVEDTARALDIPLRTFERRWKATRAWLFAEVR